MNQSALRSCSTGTCLIHFITLIRLYACQCVPFCRVFHLPFVKLSFHFLCFSFLLKKKSTVICMEIKCKRYERKKVVSFVHECAAFLCVLQRFSAMANFLPHVFNLGLSIFSIFPSTHNIVCTYFGNHRWSNVKYTRLETMIMMTIMTMTTVTLYAHTYIKMNEKYQMSCIAYNT